LRGEGELRKLVKLVERKKPQEDASRKRRRERE
jgi:hypothetical protein